jgi:two-component sensor histidine kinase
VERSVDLEAAPGSARTARRAVDSLKGTLPEATFEALLLIVSELVTNAVLHSGLDRGDRLELKIIRFGDRLRIEVTDNGVGFGRSTPSPGRNGGLGLVIVEHLSDRWGHDPGRPTRVWAELAVA